MRKIIINNFISMDGVIQAPGGPQEDTRNGFKWGGWTAPHWDELMEQTMGAIIDRPFDLLLGRCTYEIFAAHWPYYNDPIGHKFNSIEKFVVSGNANMDLSWKNSTLITGDVVTALKQLKQQDGPDLLIFGSAKLFQTLVANDLVDHLHTWIFPVTIGKGRRLFAEGTKPGNWKIEEVKTASTGVIMASYVPDGEIKLGTMESQPPSAAELERRKRFAEEG